MQVWFGNFYVPLVSKFLRVWFRNFCMIYDGRRDPGCGCRKIRRCALMMCALSPGDVQMWSCSADDVTNRRGYRMDALYMASRKALSTCVLPDADALIWCDLKRMNVCKTSRYMALFRLCGVASVGGLGLVAARDPMRLEALLAPLLWISYLHSCRVCCVRYMCTACFYRLHRARIWLFCACYSCITCAYMLHRARV